MHMLIRVTRCHLALVLACAACGASPGPIATTTAPTHTIASEPAGPMELPVVLENDRWFLVTTTAGGAPLRIFLDSAGGLFLTNAAAARLHLDIRHVKSDQGEGDVVTFPAFADPRIPRQPLDDFPLFDEEDADYDGMFGARWFDEHTFTFDYPARKLVLRPKGSLPKVAPEHAIPVAFPRGNNGAVVSPYGRIQMIVDGETIDMLVDTGATATLTEAALQALGGAGQQRATGFITDTMFQRWRKAHPTWRVIEKADHVGKLDTAMIEVQALTVGGYTVGPAWFCWRPDKAFHDFMAQYTDKPTEGALGGAAFRTLRVTIDWIGGSATFER